MKKNLPKSYNLKAKSCDHKFLDYVTKSKNDGLKIHSVFNRVINLVDPKRNLITIANNELDNGPATLIVDSKINFNFINQEMDVKCYEQKITIADKLQISLDNLKIWTIPAAKIDKVNSIYFKRNKKLFDSYLKNKLTTDGCGYFYSANFQSDKNCDKSPGAISKELNLRLSNLKAKLIAREDITAEIKSIIGFGIGLTPSGDDFLVGVLSVFYLLKEGEKLFLEIVSILKKIKIETTDISKKMLNYSMRGSTRENIYKLINSLTAEEEIKEEVIKNVLDIGSTSGKDIAVGIMTAFDVIINIRENNGG